MQWAPAGISHALVTDIMIPETDGLELIMSLRKYWSGMPILAVSGGNPASKMDFLGEALKLGAQRALKKPITKDELLQTVHEN